MALSVTTIAPSVRLTTRQSAMSQNELTSADPVLIDALIDGVSATIRTYCHQDFAREVYTETLPGYGDIHLQLKRTPVVSVASVTVRTQVVTDYSIADPGKGWLYRQNGWAWDVQVWPGLTGGGAWFDQGTPMPRQEEPNISVDYTAGYLMPEQNLVGTTTVSASSADNSFNDSANGFPATLKAGDVLVTSGFTNGENNGRFLVSGTPTTAKVVVSATLVTEAAVTGGSQNIYVQTLPADIQKAANEAVKAWYLTRGDDPTIVEKQAGPHRIRYSEQQDMLQLGLPAVCVGLLRPYVRFA